MTAGRRGTLKGLERSRRLSRRKCRVGVGAPACAACEGDARPPGAVRADCTRRPPNRCDGSTDCLRQPDHLRRGTPAGPGRRLTALRPCLATGLPLSCAITLKNTAGSCERPGFYLTKSLARLSTTFLNDCSTLPERHFSAIFACFRCSLALRPAARPGREVVVSLFREPI
jgi:hypothetical protein